MSEATNRVEQQRPLRRLAAILAADVAGYSRLMGKDEAGTLARLKAILGEDIEPRIGAHHGRVVKLVGDGVLAEFTSVVEAVECAVEIQRRLAERNAAIPEDQRLELRIGINLGDVIADGGDIHGDGVNVAARLQEAASPGGVCLSGTVFDSVGNKLDLAYRSLGERSLKNIAVPIRIYLVDMGATGSARRGADALVAALPQRPAVAVLPLENMSRDPDQEYFADGLTEEIVTALSLWREFPVIARNSSFAYKGSAMDVRKIGAELGAGYVLEGSVRRGGNRLRVIVQLIDAVSGHHLWAERFERELGDVFALQDEITRRIAATIVPELEGVEHRKAVAKKPESLSAWDCYLRGMSHIHRMTKEENARARALFAKSAELDPGYSNAFAGLAFSHLRDLLLEHSDDREESVSKAFEAARRAVSLDEASSFAHLMLGQAYLYADRHDLAIAETERAVALNPNNAHACLALGNRLDLVGRVEEGIALLERSLQLNPQEPQMHIYLGFLARAHLHARRYQDALAWAKKSAQRRPDYPQAHYTLALCLAHLDRGEEARSALADCERLHPGFVAKRAGWRPYLDAESNTHLLAGLRKAGLLQ